MANILTMLNDSSPYSDPDEATPIDNKIASGTIYRVTDATVAVLSDGYYYDNVEWDTSNTAPVEGVDCVIGFDQNNAPYLLQWQGMSQAGGINLTPIGSPAAPATGFLLYVDATDGALKAMASTGTVTTLASP